MIKLNKGMMEANGTYEELMLDFAMIVNGLLRGGMQGGLSEGFAKEKLKKHFEIGLLPTEEMAKALKEEKVSSEKKREESKEEIIGVLKELLKEVEGEENGK